jgi:hypothetical protein
MSSGGLTPPGPGQEPAAGNDPGLAPPPPPPAPGNPYFGAPAPRPPAPATDKPLGWTALGLSIPFCFPLLPLVGAVLAIVTLARRRFRPRWVAVIALVLGLLGTAGQVALVTSEDFWKGLQDGMNESLEDEADDARRSGEPTEIAPFKLREGDCIIDPTLKGVGDEQVETQTVTLLPCKDKHDLEVYAVLTLPGDDYPGQAAIDKAAGGCFPRFAKFVGKAYGQSELEIYYYFPTAQSWRLLGDKTITCVAGHPQHPVAGTLEGSKR